MKLRYYTLREILKRNVNTFIIENFLNKREIFQFANKISTPLLIYNIS